MVAVVVIFGKENRAMHTEGFITSTLPDYTASALEHDLGCKEPDVSVASLPYHSVCT